MEWMKMNQVEKKINNKTLRIIGTNYEKLSEEKILILELLLHGLKISLPRKRIDLEMDVATSRNNYLSLHF